MKKTNLSCPQCRSSEHVYKVSEIYLSGLDSIRASQPLKENAFDQVFGHPSQKLGQRFVDQATKRTLVSKFAPPASSKQRITRNVPPDMIMGATFLISLFILFNIYQQQRPLFVPALLLLLVVAGFYAATRKNILSRFDQKQIQDSKDGKNVENAIGVWMELYYCASDYIVFDQKNHTPVPIQDMNQYLLSPEAFLGQSKPKN